MRDLAEIKDRKLALANYLFGQRFALSLALGVTLAIGACGDGASPTPAPTPVAVGLDRPFRYDAQGSLPLIEDEPPPGSDAEVTWFSLRGWYVAVFDQLELEALPPLCFGVSLFDSQSRRYEYISHSPIELRACEDGGIATEVLGLFDTGARICDGHVSYLTRIPSDATGTLLASITVFPGDGTAEGRSGLFEIDPTVIAELDESIVDCAGLPSVRVPQPSAADAATPLPASTGAVPREERAAPPATQLVTNCATATAGELVNVTTTDAAPYFVRGPRAAFDAPVVIFLGGGSGSERSALRAWEVIFEDRPAADDLLVILPYAEGGGEFIGEVNRVLAIRNEVLSCYGGDPKSVHLAGTSNGGLAAFALMSAHPEYFATLAGVPGAFPVQDPSAVDPAVWASRLAGRAVLNGVGEFDGDWKPEVIATHNALARAGVESTYVEFAGQSHVLGDTFDPTLLLDFWDRR
jgi:pimeloyl-ACP methyl ester carboxylesterase